MPRPKKEGKKNIRKDISMDPEQYERLIDYCRQQDSMQGQYEAILG